MKESLRLFHALPGDFLTDHARSGNFFLEPSCSYTKIAGWIVKLLLGLSGKFSATCCGCLVDCFVGANTPFRRNLWKAFPEYCVKATPTPDFLSQLYRPDMPSGLHRTLKPTLKGFLSPFASITKVPALFTWFRQKICSKIKAFFYLEVMSLTGFSVAQIKKRIFSTIIGLHSTIGFTKRF
jgi:hypothetical protein